ncbi:MAG: PAS domain S-box protein [Bacteroidales bacterium]
MFWNFYTLLFLSLWVITLAGFIFYRQGRRKRHRKTIEKHLEERDQTYFKLKQSEERYTKLINNMNEGLIFTDSKDRIRFINQCACAIFKARSAGMIDRSILDFVLSPMEAKKLGLPYELKRPGCSHREEVQMVRTNGELFWASLNISYLDALHDHMPGAIIVMTDISEQKMAEEKLAKLTINLNQKVKQLDCLFDISDITNVPGITIDGIFERSLEAIPFGLKFPGDAWAEILFGGKRYVSKNYRDSRWSYSVPIKGQNKKLGTLRVGYPENKPLVHKDPFHINEKILVKNIAEKLGQVIEIINMQLTLKSELEKLEQIKKIARIGEWEWDLESEQARYSAGFFEMMGVSPGMQRTYNWDAFFSQVAEADLPGLKEFISGIKTGKGDMHPYTFRIRTHSGHERVILLNGHFVDGRAGSGERMIGIVQDLSKPVQNLLVQS